MHVPHPTAGRTSSVARSHTELAPLTRASHHRSRLACSTFDDPETLAQLSELGVLFLLFEMGLELSTDRLRALKVYAFGLGTVQASSPPFPAALAPHPRVRKSTHLSS